MLPVGIAPRQGEITSETAQKKVLHASMRQGRGETFVSIATRAIGTRLCPPQESRDGLSYVLGSELRCKQVAIQPRSLNR